MRRCIKAFIDVNLVIAAYFLAYLVRFDGLLTAPYWRMFLVTVPAVIIIFTLLLFLFGIYKGLWKYASIIDMILIVLACTLSVVLIFFVSWLVQGVSIPRGVLAILLLLSILFLGGARILHRIYTVYWPMLEKQRKRVLIVGAGNSGEMIVRQMYNDPSLHFKPVGFVDDFAGLQGTRIHGLPVLGRVPDIPRLVQSRRVAEVILAIPSATASEMRRAVEFCEQTGVPFQTLPGAKELINGNVTLSKIRKVKIEDLLERTPEVMDPATLIKGLGGRVILVTGAAGSIGSEICRQLARCEIKQLLMLDQAESDLFELDHELRRRFGVRLDARPVVADITQDKKLQAVFRTCKPDIVFHAAAYKHVPMMEEFPEEAVRNNIFGTLNVMQTAKHEGCSRFVLISTDKAVNPTSVMGATKRIGELLCIGENGSGKMRTSVVRFGNVLASQGSVVPLFQRQIRDGGPVTVTSKDIERYFMTIPEAVELVLQASVLGDGGDIFVLDMGEPVKVYDMARHLITLSGYKPDEEIEIRITGLRPGEKLFEELWSGEEHPEATAHPRIMRVTNSLSRRNNFSRDNMEKLRRAMDEGDGRVIRSILGDIVPSATL